MSTNLDFSNLDLGSAAEDGAPMTVRHPITNEDATYEVNGVQKPIRIFLKGNDSPTFKNRLDFHMRKKGRDKQSSIATMESESADLLAAVTTSWEGINWDNAPLECNRENAVMLYKQRPWLRRQVDEFVAEPENFFKINSNN